MNVPILGIDVSQRKFIAY